MSETEKSNQSLNVLIFNKWSSSDIIVDDMGLKDYITLTPKIIPRADGRYAKNRFHKSKTLIVERLINRLMVPGHLGKKHKHTSYKNTGKKQTTTKIVLKAFELIEQRTKKNPVEVFVKAIENAAPREELITIEYGGARYPKAVDCSPQRRVDLTLKHFVQGTYHKSFNGSKPTYEVLAEEIINAYNNNQASFAISKKLEIERQAESSR